MEGKETCKICDKSYKNLGAHVRSAHHMSMDEYGLYMVQEAEEGSIEDANESDDTLEDVQEEVTLEDFHESVDVEEAVYSDELSDILKEYKISKGELIIILENYRKRKKGSTPDKVLEVEDVAKNLSTETNPSTINVKVAEILVKKYGFSIKGGGPTTQGGKIQKTWFMYK